jgi:hypothetical protein
MSTTHVELLHREIVARHEAMRRQAAEERLAVVARGRRPGPTLRRRVGTAGRIVACWLTPA